MAPLAILPAIATFFCIVGSIVNAVNGDWVTAAIFAWVVLLVWLVVGLLVLAYEIGKDSA